MQHYICLYSQLLYYNFIRLPQEIPLLMKISQKNQQPIKNQVKNSPPSCHIKRVRESEPNLIFEEKFINAKDEKIEQRDTFKRQPRQPRHSEVLCSEAGKEFYHSPQHEMAKQVSTPAFHSPGAMKKGMRVKSAYSPYAETAAQPVGLVIHNHIGKPQIKNRKNPIQNHKETLNKIEEMLLSHGIKIGNCGKDIKNKEENQKGILKTPPLKQKLDNIAFNIKNRQNGTFNYQAIPVDKEQQTKQLKETVSTHSSFKSSRQLKVSDFQVGKELGKGKFGVVRLVRHKKTGILFCLKIIKKSVIRKEQLMQQLIKQTKIQLFLNEPNIIKLYSVFDDSQSVYLLLELCCEGNLYQFMKKYGKISQNETRTLIKSLCEGVFVLHRQNIIHRDLKPQNIVLCFSLAKICDFGWSTMNKDTMRQTFCGTPLYVSPQLLSGSCYDEKVDLWAIGILTFEMLTGRNPFQIKSQKDLSKIVSTKISYPDILSKEAISFLEDLLEKNPQKRKSIAEILDHPFLQLHRAAK